MCNFETLMLLRRPISRPELFNRALESIGQYEHAMVDIKIELMPAKWIDVFAASNYAPAMRGCVLKFSAWISTSDYHLLDHPDSQEIDAETRTHVACLDFYDEIRRFMVVANFAYLGALSMMDSVTTCDAKLAVTQLESLMGDHILLATDFAAVRKWPSMEPMDLSVLMNWLKEHGEDLSGLRGHPLSRAFAAFTQLLRKDITSPEALLFAMIGIEAIYCEGTGDLSRQVNQKVKLLLGEPSEFKRSVTQMYDFRSRFVHGDFDFPSILGEDTREGDKKSTEMNVPLNTAIAILCATLQEVIRRNWKDITFRYTVEG